MNLIKGNISNIPTNEFTIKRRIDIGKIKNKEQITKLIIESGIRPHLLKRFNNVKELVLDNCSYTEENINKLSFKDNIEKLTCKSMYKLGVKCYYHDYGCSEKNYTLPLSNLKVLELDQIGLDDIYSNYLKNLEKLETIIFNLSDDTRLSTSSKYPLLLPQNLKEIVVKTEYNDHIIKLDYIPSQLKALYFGAEGIHINFSNDYINTEILINNNKMNVTNTLICPNDSMIKDECLYIPDYINDIKVTGGGLLPKIDSISINPSKLKLNEINEYSRIDKYIQNINKVIIRNNNEMKLNPNLELSSNNYGKLESIYIENKKLYIVFDNYKFIITEEGKLNREINIKQNQNDVNTTNKTIESKYNKLNKFTSTELEYYTYYKKILELLSPTNKEVSNAMNIIEKELIKQLKKSKE